MLLLLIGRNLLYTHLGGSITLAQVALHIIWIRGLELHSICFKKCTHAMAMGYFLQYIAFYSWPGITALVPICSLYGYLAGAITSLYPLATKVFTVYAYWYQSCFFYALGTKAFVSITLPRAANRWTSHTPKPVFILNLNYLQMVSL